MFGKKVTALLILLLGIIFIKAQAQLPMPPTGGNGRPQDLFNQSDSTGADSNRLGKNSWEDPNVKIYYTNIGSDLHVIPDSTLKHFQHFRPLFPWWGKDLGNYGSAFENNFFSPATRMAGPSLGYPIYNIYGYNPDSLRFYNTTNPYSEFSFVLGSKEQQIIKFLHTQNIRPNWNFAANFQTTNSQGFFTGQTAKVFSGSLNTWYQSKNQHYQLKAGIIYNHFSQDENGGIASDSFLSEANFKDRRRIPVNIPTITAGADRSSINNSMSNLELFAQNHYSWGKIDTVYNKDSTKRNLVFIPRFGFEYDFRYHHDSHLYKDFTPDSNRYLLLDPLTMSFRDTLRGIERWSYLSNKFSLNGFVGKPGHLLKAQAGIGNEIDLFKSLTPEGYDPDKSFNTFLFGNIIKESNADSEWHYDANAELFLTGEAIGDFYLNANFGKQINKWAGFTLGLSQRLSSPDHAFSQLSSNFFDVNYGSFSKMNLTLLYAKLAIPKYEFFVTVNYYLLGNYLYYSDSLQPVQQAGELSLYQVTLEKPLRFGGFVLESRIAYQQNIGNSPIHLPKMMIREEFAWEGKLFKKALAARTGVNVGYTTDYFLDGYSPYINNFYTQDVYRPRNYPSVNAFFNFSVRHFRAFFSLDELQQFLVPNNINALGYPAENFMFRFGFKWVLLN